MYGRLFNIFFLLLVHFHFRPVAVVVAVATFDFSSGFFFICIILWSGTVFCPQTNKKKIYPMNLCMFKMNVGFETNTEAMILIIQHFVCACSCTMVFFLLLLSFYAMILYQMSFQIAMKTTNMKILNLITVVIIIVKCKK